jgi:nucleoside-diphosphate-sugar epimerase
MRVLVTGATGFVGSHLAETLVGKGHQVRVLARKTSDLRWIRHLPLEWAWGDVEQPQGLIDACREVQWVIHAAGVTKARGYGAYARINAQGTRHLLDACLRQARPPDRIVLVSSLAAWGPCSPLRPRDPWEPGCPVSHYGRSKLEAEQIAGAYAHRLHVVVVRPTAVYGPRDRDFLSVFRLMKKGWNLTVGSDGPHMCLIHVRDLAEGILLAADREVPSGSVFFLSDGENRTWPQVAGVLERVLGVKARHLRLPVWGAWVAAVGAEWLSGLRGIPPLLNREKLREMRQSGWTCDIGDAVRSLGFSPTICLEDGFRETYRWYLENGWL